jgi:hypothetical protein
MSALYFYSSKAFVLLVHRRRGPNLIPFLRNRYKATNSPLTKSEFDDTEDTMQILDWITCKRVERKEFASLFCLVLLSIFTRAVALAQAPPTPFESSALGKPARDVTMAGTVHEAITKRPALPACLA